MTTEVGLWLYGDAEEELIRGEEWVRSMELRLSRFRDESELCRLNRLAGTGAVPVSEELFELVADALQLAERLQGLFDPTVLPAMVRAGFGSGPTLGRIGFRQVCLDSGRRTISLPLGVALDLGGIAKGWMADRLAHELSRYGPCLVDIGGDLRAAGPLAWPVALDDPWKPGRPVVKFHLKDEGVATSSLLKRGNHVIDPRTGAPVQTDLVAATVRAPAALPAEGLAKAALIMGRCEGWAFLEKEGFRGVLFGKEHSIS